MSKRTVLNSNFNQAVICKISIFNEIALNFTYSQKSQFFKYNWKFLDQPLLPYKFHGSDMSGMYFLIFASCEPLIRSFNLFLQFLLNFSVYFPLLIILISTRHNSNRQHFWFNYSWEVYLFDGMHCKHTGIWLSQPFKTQFNLWNKVRLTYSKLPPHKRYQKVVITWNHQRQQL